MWSPLYVASCADDYPSALVGDVHQYLRPFAGLGIFVGDVMYVFVVAYVLKVPVTGSGNRNFKRFHP